MFAVLQVTINSKKPDVKITPKRKSRRLAEITRQEMLKARREAYGSHEVGDTPSDPLVLLFEEEEEMEPAKPTTVNFENSLNEDPDSLTTGDGSPPRESGFIYYTMSDSGPST